MEKRYTLIHNIEFSINMESSLRYIENEYYHESEYPPKKYLHIRVMLYENNKYYRWKSVYIPKSKLVKDEEKNMIKHREDYEPSEEFIHLVRTTTLIIMRRTSAKARYV